MDTKLQHARIDRRTLLGWAGGAVGLAALGAATRPWRALEAALTPFSGVPVAITGPTQALSAPFKGHAPLPSRSVDVVVVGAGVSGLTAAHALDGADVLVLESGDRAGGHARCGIWNGVVYAEGGADLSDVSGHVGALIDTLGIPLVPVRRPGDAYMAGDRLTVDVWGAGAPAGFRSFMADLRALRDTPVLPVESATTAALAYDTHSLAQLARPYGPEVMRFLDLYARSVLGAPASAVSAYAGLRFLTGELHERWSAPGGMAVVAEALIRAVGPSRIVTDASVVRVAHAGERVLTTYRHRGELVTVSSRAVVMAAPKPVAAGLVADLPPAQRAAMASVAHAPSLVLNVLVEGAVPRPAYATWASGTAFTDVIVADWTRGPRALGHGVLTAYCPLGADGGAVLADDRAVSAIARRAVAELDRLHPGLGDRVRGVRARRHAAGTVVAAVGGLADAARKAAQPHGRIFFAHSDGQLASTIEAAVWEGQKAGLLATGAIRHHGTPGYAFS